MSDLPSWKGVRRLGIDCETHDPNLRELGIGAHRDGTLVGISFAIEDGPKHYLPIRHEGGDNLPAEGVLSYLREQAALFDGELVGANLSYDLSYLWAEGILFPQVKYYRDIQVADPLIYELHQSYSLQKIAERHGLPGKDEQLLKEAAAAYGVSPKGGLWRLPARFVGEYATQDAAEPLLILRRQERMIEADDLWDIYNLESEVLPVLVRMRQRGVRVDQDRLSQIEQWSLTEEAECLARVRHTTGVRIDVGDVWKPNVLAPALQQIGVKLEKTPKGQPSIKAEILDSIDHHVAKDLARARKVNKLRTTFADSLRRYMVNGRIHCTFNQIAREDDAGDQKGARYGRLSCVHPNLQQQPSRDEFAARWRSIYLPEEGGEWASCDYSQQEPRWTTHFAAECGLEGAAEACQAYHDDPDLDNHQFMADLTGLDRKFAKCVYLGLCYGEGGGKLCDDLGLPTRWALGIGRGRNRKTLYFQSQDDAFGARRDHGEGFIWRAAGEEGQEVIDKFDGRAPFIKKVAKKAEQAAKTRGYVLTGGGRRLHFPQRQDGSYDWAHKGLNRVIQGTSADQTKKAIVEIDRAGHWLMLQVHDETANSVSGRPEAKEISAIMSDVVKARVPFKVDIDIGPSWGEAA